MITGLHTLLFVPDPEAVRAFLRDVLEFPHVDAGGGWLIFRAPPAEIGVHPPESDWTQGLFLMCDDIRTTVAELQAKGATFVGEVEVDPDAGLMIRIALPGGGELPLYQPSHPLALDLEPSGPN